MILTKRVVATTLMGLTFWLWGGPVAAAHTSTPSGAVIVTLSAASESTGPDTTRSILFAGIAGLAVGGVIAFWQSRKRRQSDDRERGGRPDSSDD